MKTTTLRVTMLNNSDARSLRLPALPRGAAASHNGGKIVIVTGMTEEETATYSDLLDAPAARVATYTW